MFFGFYNMFNIYKLNFFKIGKNIIWMIKYIKKIYNIIYLIKLIYSLDYNILSC